MTQIINFEELRHLNIDFGNSLNNVLSLGGEPQRNQIIYQVFFLPSDDVNNPRDITAFCPFTKILAHGTTISEAAQNWTKIARKKIQNCQSVFCIPRYFSSLQSFLQLVVNL
jgi:hypothetical protein